MTIVRTTAAIALALLAACSPAPSASEAAAQREIAHMAPMKTNPAYSTTVTGFDVSGSGRRVDVSIDLNQYESIDDDAVDALKAEALRRWKEAWLAENEGKHATLAVRFLNYFGKPFLTENAKV